MRRITGVLTACIIIMTMMTACGSGQTAAAQGTPGSAGTAGPATAPQPGKVNIYGWKVPDKTTQFSMYFGQDNPDVYASRIKDLLPWIRENFNVSINSSVYDIDKDQKLNLMLAANDYPDVLTSLSEDQAIRFVSQNRVVDLSPYMGQHGQNIKKGLDRWNVYKSLFSQDGKLYYLPTTYGIVKEPDNTACLRYDWYTALGSPECKTPDEYYSILEKMVRMHPTNSKAEKAYALSSSEMETWGGDSMLTGLAGIWGMKDQYKEGADHSLTHWINTGEGLEMTEYINRFNLDGLLDPDMFVNKYEDFKTKFSVERIYGQIGPWWNSWNAGHEVWMQTDPAWNQNKRFFQFSLKATDAERSYMSGKSARSSFSSFTIITDKAKDPAAILDWIDYTNTDTGRWIPGYGIPERTPGDGALWRLKDGKPDFTEGPMNDLINDKIDFNSQVWGRGALQLYLVEPIEGVRGNNTSYSYDHAFTDRMKWWNKLIQDTSDSIYDNTLQQSITIDPSTPLGVEYQQIKDTLLTGWAKAIYSGSRAECIRNFYELRDKVNAMGMHDIEKYRTEEYRKLLSKQEN